LTPGTRRRCVRPGDWTREEAIVSSRLTRIGCMKGGSMAATDRRPPCEWVDPKVLTAMQKAWSSKDTRMFRLRVREIERARETQAGGEEGRVAAVLVRV
jgi:hypothetical protein